MAWAKAHGIRPPVELLVAVAESQSVKSCCQRRLATAERQAGHRKACCNSLPASEAASKPTSERSEPVHGFSALKCKGLAQHWVTSGAVAPPPARIAAHSSPVGCGWIAMTSTPQILSFDSPPVPPPKIG
jgi:hypothetical protein